jgi:hypothetical protein
MRQNHSGSHARAQAGFKVRSERDIVRRAATVPPLHLASVMQSQRVRGLRSDQRNRPVALG